MTLKIGTRGSPLALAQTHQVRDLLVARDPALAEPGATSVEVIKTTGDAVLDRPLSEIGGKGLFTKEIDEAQLGGTVDLAVHSMKDVQTVLPEGIVLAAILPREDPRDAFISLKYKSFAEMPAGAKVGTASLRRGALVRAARPDLEVVMFRGNVQTRLTKLKDGVADATMLAMAGLNRLDMAQVATAPLSLEEMLPAVAQGAVGVTCRADDAETQARVAALNCLDTADCVACERAFLEVLDGSCRTPIAGYARLSGDRREIVFNGLVALPDGSEAHRCTWRAPRHRARALGKLAGEELRARAGEDFYARMLAG
ncbi:hydroxymethylbilane synthase [Roseospirillum parvum]|uniref:Porphobilinogen deaminase n=1 Tax=Roseospirillum parvum TaxID=83401 RepID=A0A1G7ZUA8_9PROT|nr:hydroxymethylbilane synthase [Roseospirillum parvum]SDH12289.1 hydroxymethylbilane synthase [Roseospirillum parvum]